MADVRAIVAGILDEALYAGVALAATLGVLGAIIILA